MNPGTRFGPYLVESLLGAGGMGEVYRATDTRLGRTVAIKILGHDRVPTAVERERFEREARLISKLNHPNICALYDLGRHEDTEFLVMEYLEGETLAERIGRGPLPLDQLLRVGRDVAAALEAAHREGIIHRDLKPANVMLTRTGVKLLDFGLARLSAPDSAGPDSATFLHGPERSLTAEGTIVGTFAYMAPEQVQGAEVDRRTDIFALGAILYEMATAHRAFDGPTRASIIAAVLEREPAPMTDLQPLTPPALERLVRACLAKDRDERIQAAHDVALELKWIGEGASSTSEGQSVQRKSRAPWIIAAVAAAVAVGSAGLFVRYRGRDAAPYTLSIATPQELNSLGISAISPDGRSLAFAARSPSGQEGIWLRRLDDDTPKLLATKGPGPTTAIFWSPDGRWVGYDEGKAKLMRVHAAGGEPERIAATAAATGAAWLPDGTILFAPHFGTGLFRVDAAGGTPEPLTRLDARRREVIHCSPVAIPGGRGYLYLAYTVAEERSRIYAASLDNAARHFVVEADALIGYSRPYLLFARDGGIYAQRFDERQMAVAGEAVRVVDGVSWREPDALAFASVSEGGLLAYLPAQPSKVDFNVYTRTGALVRTLWTEPDLWLDVDLAETRAAPNGRALAVAENDPSKGASDVAVVDLGRSIAVRITGGRSTNRNPVWSPDGQSVAFCSDRQGSYDVYVAAADGSRAERLLWRSPIDKHVTDWSSDGKSLLVTVDGPDRDIWVLPLDGKPWPLVRSEGIDTQPQFSPDGKWVAYSSNRTGRNEVYVCGFPSGPTVRISAAGGQVPTWSADGKELLFSTGAGEVMLASIRETAGRVDPGVPVKLFTRSGLAQAPRFMHDGTILVAEPHGSSPERFNITTAWRQRAP